MNKTPTVPGLLDETPEEIAEAITRLSAEAAKMSEHWVDRRAALDTRVDTLLDRLLAHSADRSGRLSTFALPEQHAPQQGFLVAVLTETIGGMTRIRFYRAHERPEVGVLVEDAWFRGELRMWTRHQHGSWSANVTWGREGGESRIGAFPAEHVRPLVEP